jgi:hypothetical protein
VVNVGLTGDNHRSAAITCLVRDLGAEAEFISK